MIGVYQLRNVETGKRYIGQSANLSHRKSCHFYDLRNNRHKNHDLQEDYNRNPDAIVFEVLCRCSVEDLDDLERFFIQKYEALSAGYNLSDGGIVGCRHADESKEKMAIAKLGNQHMSGKTLTEEWRRRISDSQPHKRKIRCIETGAVFGSFAEAARETGLNRTKIVSCCTGKRKRTGGYRFEYADTTADG